MNINNVLIVGGGIGGLCTAIALRQAGVAVDVVEIQPQWRVYGVGIIQQNNVVREMQRLGVLERYLDAAWPFDSVSVHTLSGQQLASFPGQRLAGEQFPANVGISRLALHNVLSSLDSPIAWDPVQRGIRVSDYTNLAQGSHRHFYSARYAKLGADQTVDGQVIFNVEVRNRGVFSERLAVADIIDDLLRVSGSRPLHLPAFDLRRNNSCAVTGFSRRPLFYNVEGSQESWGEFLIRHGRMTEEEVNQRMAAYEAGRKAEAEIPIAWCRHGGSTKSYAYPARDLVLTASTSLQGYVDDRRNKDLPASLVEAGSLCATGFKAIRDSMEDKPWFSPSLSQFLANGLSLLLLGRQPALS